MYVYFVDQQIKKILDEMRSIAKQILTSSVSELMTKSLYKTMMGKMQSLLVEHSKNTSKIGIGCCKMLRKLIFLFSRCSRYLGYLVCASTIIF